MLLLLCMFSSAAIAANGGTGVIDGTGKTIIPCRYWSVEYLGEGYFYAVDPGADSLHRSYAGELFDYAGHQISLILPEGCTLSHAFVIPAAKLEQLHAPKDLHVVAEIHSSEGFGLCKIDGTILLEPRHALIYAPTDEYFPIGDGPELAAKLIVNVHTRARQQLVEGTNVLNYKPGALHPFQQRGWGYARDDGTVAIEPHYVSAGPFSSDGVALVKVRIPTASYPKDAFINKAGKVVSPYYDQATPFCHGIASVWECGADHTVFERLIDTHFNCIIGQYSSAQQIFSWGFVVRNREGDSYMAVNANGELVFECPVEVKTVGLSSEGLVLCELRTNTSETKNPEREFLYIDETGKPVLRVTGVRALPMTYGCACVGRFLPGHPLQWEVIDRAGRTIQPSQDANFRPLTLDRIAKMVRDDRFDQARWKTSMNRLTEFAQFLRNYNLIAMKKDEVCQLLGPDSGGSYSRCLRFLR